MKLALEHYWTALLPIGLLLAIVTALVLLAAHTDSGKPVYPVDDAYIHMALAKNLMESGNWGLRSTGFQGVSSSPLWTLLMSAAYRFVGPSEITPLVLNLICGCGVVLVIYFAGNRRRWPKYWTLCIALAVVIWCPLFANVFSGMEHSLQILLTLLLFTFAGEFLAKGKANTSRGAVAFDVVGGVATATRYEDCFLVFAICLMLAIQRRWVAAAAIAAAGLFPIVAYAAYSIIHGGMWAPTTVLVKAWGISSRHAFAKYTLVGAAMFKLVAIGPYMIPLILLATLMYFHRRHWRRKEPASGTVVEQIPETTWLYPIWIISTVLHLDLAALGWYYRYEAYLLAMGLFTIGAMAAPLLPRRIHWKLPRLSSAYGALMGILILLLVVCMTGRAAQCRSLISPESSRNIEQKRYQLAKFFGEYYPGGVVAINDIGAASYFTDVKIVDLCGLGSIDVGREILHRTYDTNVIGKVCAQNAVQLAGFVFVRLLSMQGFAEIVDSRGNVVVSRRCAHPGQHNHVLCGAAATCRSTAGKSFGFRKRAASSDVKLFDPRTGGTR